MAGFLAGRAGTLVFSALDRTLFSAAFLVVSTCLCISVYLTKKYIIVSGDQVGKQKVLEIVCTLVTRKMSVYKLC